MPGLLEGKVCLITGAARGIGKAISLCFAQEGAIVYANERQAGTVSDWCAIESQNLSGTIIPICFDVTDSGAIRAGVMKIRKEQGRLDVLVNNAGVEYNDLIGMIPEDHLRNMLEVNVIGTINMVQYCSRIMTKSSDASIINIASVVGVYGNAGQSAYAATKGAVISFTKSAAKELGPNGIRVNAIAPGLTKTDMFLHVDKEKVQQRVNSISLGRVAEPEDIALSCVYLASGLSGYVSGQVLCVDGSSIL